MGSEIAIDVLAAKMGIDPFDIREMNCYKESEGSTIPTGYPPEVYPVGMGLSLGCYTGLGT